MISKAKYDTHHLINNYRRKRLIEFLLNNDGICELNDVISYIVESEGKEMNNKTRKSVYVSLIQNHIPKLELGEIVRYDRRENKVLLLEMPEDMKVYFETVRQYDIPWCYYYLALSTIVLFASYYAENLLAVLISTLFLLSSIVNIYTNRIKI